jgi:hypothetical protein
LNLQDLKQKTKELQALTKELQATQPQEQPFDVGEDALERAYKAIEKAYKPDMSDASVRANVFGNMREEGTFKPSKVGGGSSGGGGKKKRSGSSGKPPSRAKLNRIQKQDESLGNLLSQHRNPNYNSAYRSDLLGNDGKHQTTIENARRNLGHQAISHKLPPSLRRQAAANPSFKMPKKSDLDAAIAHFSGGKKELAELQDKAGARHNRTDQEQLQAVHDSAVALGAVCPS